jgi:four helix bundle protein
MAETECRVADEAVKNYRGLLAWQRSMDLVEFVYKLTENWPKSEQFGLTNQIRRAAVSVPSNIAEGQGRNSPLDFARFLSIAHGSLREVETQLLIAERLGYANQSEIAEAFVLAGAAGRYIQGLTKTVRGQAKQK